MPQKSLTKFYEDESASAALFNLPLNDADDNFAELYAAVGAAGDMKKADYDDDDDKIVEAAEFSGESAALVGEMLSYSAYDISALDGRIIDSRDKLLSEKKRSFGGLMCPMDGFWRTERPLVTLPAVARRLRVQIPKSSLRYCGRR